jgi:hypothetical protein
VSRSDTDLPDIRSASALAWANIQTPPRLSLLDGLLVCMRKKRVCCLHDPLAIYISHESHQPAPTCAVYKPLPTSCISTKETPFNPSSLGSTGATRVPAEARRQTASPWGRSAPTAFSTDASAVPLTLSGERLDSPYPKRVLSMVGRRTRRTLPIPTVRYQALIRTRVDIATQSTDVQGPAVAGGPGTSRLGLASLNILARTPLDLVHSAEKVEQIIRGNAAER